ncbi:hypothetical protein SLEP1_g33514 [Rubroshorea leprosula]|uniref:1-phosphatidylinositol-4-phosphate 5-kinase n=1 Tax=Rubroshorea leprosula TaxID=152421 RepID=A0AAV5KGU2_9ROSI|nr:hypothetical protein SLEP1_g33514 [Rubroshorea leprosula]
MTQLKYLLNEDHESHAEQRGHVSCTNVEDVERLDEKELSNGDVYVGTFKGILPHGKGKYTWSDGTVYDGDWEEGKMTGKGQIFWPSEAKYEGDFSGGYLHGSGTLVDPDGSIYRGTWRMNIRHGLGKREYCNSDIYEGSWREGVHEGSGKYSWNNGNTYIGNWKHGKMHGRGVMKWANGDVFYGFWFNGLRHGFGIYRFADGGYYFGTWTRGLKDGKGTFYLAGSKHPFVKKWHAALGYDDSGKGLLAQSSSLNAVDFEVKKPIVKCSISEKISGGGSLSTGRMSHRTTLLDANSNLSDAAIEIIHHDSSFTMSHGSDDDQSEVQDNNAIVYEREYKQGVCIKDIMRNYAELSHNTKQPNKFHSKGAKKSLCASIFRGNDSYYLMLNLQLGIRYTVGKINPQPNHDVRASDFGDRARITMFFPRRGSQFTPPHKSVDFYWKDYCPTVFRYYCSLDIIFI